jgi:hypothetical protein
MFNQKNDFRLINHSNNFCTLPSNDKKLIFKPNCDLFLFDVHIDLCINTKFKALYQRKGEGLFCLLIKPWIPPCLSIQINSKNNHDPFTSLEKNIPLLLGNTRIPSSCLETRSPLFLYKTRNLVKIHDSSTAFGEMFFHTTEWLLPH